MLRWTVTLSIALCVALPMMASTSAEAAPPAGTGSISGLVVDGGGTPLAGICVNIENGPGTQTDGNGEYSIPDLAAGSYWLQFIDCQPSPAYVTQWYAGQTDRSSATAVDVLDDLDTPLADVTMQPGVSVTGTVTDGGGNPLGGINVWVNPTNGQGVSSGAQTAPDGTYATSPVPSGDYRVQFSDPSWTFATQYWNQQLTWGSAQALQVSVANGSVASGIDAVLAAAATISGTVTDGNGQPLEGICVSGNILRNGGTDNVGQTTTASDGTYTIAGLPPTDLRVQYHDCNPTQHYLDQWYGNVSDANNSPAIVVAPAEQRSGIDAQLQGGISVAGTVTDSQGNPIAGINVNVNPTSSGPSSWAQTGADGTYVTGPVPPGDYRVQFSAPGGPNPAWANEFWHQQPSWNTADILTITADDAPVRTGIDAMLNAAASISGTVTGPQGQPVEGICVNAIINTVNGLDGLANTTTAADGTYVLAGLAAMDVEVLFDDCNHVGPYARQAWHASRTLNDATHITLTAGLSVTGIDAQLVAAGSITGTVRNANHVPLAGICVQATTDTFVGGLTSTDGSGNYALVLDRPGDYHVQFVDCSQTPTYAGQWWTASSSVERGTVTVTPGATVAGIDAELTTGPVATISGRVVNAHGDAMTSACIVAYLPNQFAVFAPVEADGTYTLHNVPSGTYAIAFLGCDQGQPVPTVTDPADPTVTYSAVWWRNVPLTLDVSPDGGPDPIAQGALLVTVAPGANLSGFDHCFGCLPPITITSITTTNDSITVAFSTAEQHTESFAPELGPTIYTLTCSSPAGGTRSTSAASSPITVNGVTPGATYSCNVTSSDGSTSTTSSAFSVAVPTMSVQPATIAEPTIAPTPAADPTPAAAAATLPRTGLDPRGTLAWALALVILGLATRRVSARHHA